jgi:hypothetical protein
MMSKKKIRKTPPRQFRDDVCREKTEAFIKGESNE